MKWQFYNSSVTNEHNPPFIMSDVPVNKPLQKIKKEDLAIYYLACLL